MGLSLSWLAGGIPSPQARCPAVTMIALIYNDPAVLKQRDRFAEPRGGHTCGAGRGGGGNNSCSYFWAISIHNSIPVYRVWLGLQLRPCWAGAPEALGRRGGLCPAVLARLPLLPTSLPPRRGLLALEAALSTGICLRSPGRHRKTPADKSIVALILKILSWGLGM